MDVDHELDGWRRDWQSMSEIPVELRERVARETRSMRRYRIGEVLVTIVFGGGSLGWAALSHRDDLGGLVVGIWVFIAMAWGMSWVLRSGTWAPPAATTAAFLNLSILRCRRRRDAILAQAALYAMLLTFNLWWVWSHNSVDALGTFLMTDSVLAVWLITAVLAALAVGQHRQLGRQLEALISLQRQLEGNASNLEDANTWHSSSFGRKRGFWRSRARGH